MSIQSEERMSALLDGESLPGEIEALLAELETEPLLAARWSRECAVRDARAGVAIRAELDLTSGVMAAIAAGAAVDANPVVVPLRRAEPLVRPVAVPRHRALRWQPVAGLAAAASLAAVAVVSGRALIASRDAGSAQVAVAQPAAAAGGSRWASTDPDAARQLDGFLMEHSNSRAEAGMGGSLSYARLAVRTADYRPDDGQR